MVFSRSALNESKAAFKLPSSRKEWMQFCAVGVGCYLAGLLGLQATNLHPPVSPVWPPTGVELAAILLLGYSIWPAVFIATFLVCLTAATPVHAALAISVANTLEPIVAAYLVKRFAGGISAFESPQGVVKFVLSACFLGPALDASLCLAYLYQAGYPQGPDKGMMWLTWTAGDAIGALLFAPFLILLFGTQHHRLDKREFAELVVLLLGLIATCLTVFGPLSLRFEQKQLLMPWMCLPFIIWIGFRFCQLEASGSALLLFGLAIWGTLHGYGPFVTPDFNVSVMFLAVFVGVTATATLAIAATLSERRHVEEGLLGLQSILQETVHGKSRDLTATIETLQAEVVERMQAEAKLRESNDRFQQLTSAISDVFWLMDVANMRLLYISPAYETVWGRPCKSMYDDPHSWLDAVHPDDYERALIFFDLQTKESRYDAEYRIVRPDGEVRNIWDRGYVVRDQRGRICRVAGLASDITEKKRLQEELQEAQKWKQERN
jgi:PAS domain S-box-containing protein